MNRRILIALIARADLDHAEHVEGFAKFSADPAVRLAASHAKQDARQMHSGILQCLSGVEMDHYKAALAVMSKDSMEFDSKECPHCDTPDCTEPVALVCRCRRCESEGSHHEDRFYVCSNIEHKERAEKSHFRMRERICQWDVPRS